MKYNIKIQSIIFSYGLDKREQKTIYVYKTGICWTTNKSACVLYGQVLGLSVNFSVIYGTQKMRS